MAITLHNLTFFSCFCLIIKCLCVWKPVSRCEKKKKPRLIQKTRISRYVNYVSLKQILLHILNQIIDSAQACFTYICLEKFFFFLRICKSILSGCTLSQTGRIYALPLGKISRLYCFYLHGIHYATTVKVRLEGSIIFWEFYSF